MSSPKYITIGNASTANAAKADQVLTKRYSLIDFTNRYKGWRVVRPRDPDLATRIASLMVTACDNNHILYKYGGKDMVCTGGKYKINTKTDCYTDCAALVCECVSEAIGKNFYSPSSGLESTLEGLSMGKQKVFYSGFTYSTFAKTPVYNGDVVIRAGHHALLIVGGSPRNGQPANPGGSMVDISYNGHVTPVGNWMDGWGVTIYSAKGDSGQPNGRGVANPSVNCKGTSIKDDKGFISVAAGKEWKFNTRFEIKELPGVVFQVDDRGKSSLFDGQKHLDIFTLDYNEEEYVTTSDNKRVGLKAFASKHQWNKNQDLHIREVSSTSSSGTGYDQAFSDASAGSGGGGSLDLEVEYSFVPRNQKFKESDEWYKFYQEAYGKSYGKTYNGSYAWGRFSEVCQESCKLGTSYPRLWYNHKGDGYQRGAAPSLGAVMCYTNTQDAGDAGFAAIVEIVHTQYIYISYCDSKNAFHYKKLSQKDGTWNLDLDKDGVAEYLFQGFIYNPHVTDSTVAQSRLDKFLKCANSNVPDGKGITEKYTGINTSKKGWSAAFINACAIEADGLINVILPDTNAPSDIGYIGIESDFGVWYDGPAQGKIACPQVGDIVLFRTQTGVKYADRYAADAAGIVTGVSTWDKNQSAKGPGNKDKRYKCTIVQGDVKGAVAVRELISSNNQISGIFRPHWNRVDGVSEITKWTISPVGMYNEGTTIEDAAIRDISYTKYEKKKYQPSIKKSGITLSAINYTGMLSNMYSVLAGLKASADNDANVLPNIYAYTTISEYDIDIFATEPRPAEVAGPDAVDTALREGLAAKTSIGIMTVNTGARAIFDELNDKLKNRAGTVGIMACLWKLSAWKADAMMDGIGILQWKDADMGDKRATQLKEWCKTKGTKRTWKDNLSGQITFLIHEMTTNATYKKVWKKLMDVKKTEAGSEKACQLFYKNVVVDDSSKTATPTAGMTEAQAAYAAQQSVSYVSELTELYEYCETTWNLFIGGSK